MSRMALEQAGETAFTMMHGLGRLSIESLDTLAKMTESTPLSPFFRMQAYVAETAFEGFEAVGRQIGFDAKEETAGAVVAPAGTDVATPGGVVEPEVAAQPAARSAPEKTADAVEEIVEEAAEVLVEGDDVDAMEIDAASIDEDAADDLSAINGIGPATQKKLADAGVKTFKQLATISEADLKAILEAQNVRMMRFAPQDWIDEAKAHA